jgi:DNA-binding MurR/RpiR family transcriptional regulator
MRTLSEIDQNSRHPIDTVLMDHAAALAMLQTPEARAQLANAVEELGKASRVAVFGIGPSRYLAEYMCFSLRRFGLSAYALTAAGASMADQLLDLCPGDALIMLAYGRSYREAEVVLSEAVRLKVPSVLITDSYDERLTRNAKTLVRVPRGRKDHVAMHGATLVALEAVLMALAAVARSRALVQLDRLNELRGALRVPAREARR